MLAVRCRKNKLVKLIVCLRTYLRSKSPNSCYWYCEGSKGEISPPLMDMYLLINDALGGGSYAHAIPFPLDGEQKKRKKNKEASKVWC